MRRRRQQSKFKNEESTELNLIPIMNLFVCLLPFLLLTAAFVRMGAVRVELPKAQAGEINPAKPKATQQVDLVFMMTGKQVVVTGYTDNFSMPVNSIQASFSSRDTKSISKYIDKLSEQKTNLGSALFKANPQTRFEDAVKVLSTLRKDKALKSVVLATEVVN